MLKPKVSIIGCGNVGMRYAYALMISGTARQITLVDYNIEKAEGEAMDLSHGAPYTNPVEIVAGTYKDVSGSDLVVITAGKKQKPGQTRVDLLKDNIDLFRTIIPEIVKYAPNAILLIASNPVDILTYAAYKISGKKASSVIGSGTLLDSARFRYEIAKHCNIDPRSIHAYILGEHGDTEFPVWSKATVGGVNIDKYCMLCDNTDGCNHKEKLDEIFKNVKNSAYNIIEKKGETSYGIGLALVRITQALLQNENAVLPVSVLVEDFCGINDAYLSLPAVINAEGIRQVQKLEFNDAEKQAFVSSAEILKKLLKEVGF
ncbi:MAG: L-lactate dehydrogenase [Endomicrobiaceae bacterium]|jgi:L-lactate dehydrogenase|nr:L-lactate dehydrogenase [Endomicrobiaceae bacterium]